DEPSLAMVVRFGGPASHPRSLSQVALQAHLDELRILAIGDADEAVLHQLTLRYLLLDERPELAGNRQKDEIRRGDAVNRGDESDGDPVAKLGRIGQILHDVYQPKNRTQEADGRRITAGGFPDAGGDHQPG